MPKRETHLGAARQHGRVAVTELRHMTADAALYWVLSHRGRVAQFRRAVKGTGAERALQQLLARIKSEATALPRRRPRKAARKSTRTARSRRASVARYFSALTPFPPI